MRLKSVGQTGIMVSELTLGSNTFGGGNSKIWSGMGALDQRAVSSIVAHAFEAGINSFDTADIYGAGESEIFLGQALRDLSVPRSSYVISTKTGMRNGPGANDIGLSRSHIIASVDASLKRLGTDFIDCLMLHGIDPLTDEVETLSALDQLVRSGKVRFVGCSNFAAWQTMKLLGLSESRCLPRMQLVACQYSAGARDVEREIVPLTRDQKLAFFAWAPLANGILTGKHGRTESEQSGTRMANGRFSRVERPHERERLFDVAEVLVRLAERRGTAASQMAIAWLLHQQCVTSVVFGVSRLEQLEQNLKATQITLEPDEINEIDAAGALPEEYPAWMLERQYASRESVRISS